MASSSRIYQAERILRDTFDRYHAGVKIIIHGTQIIVPQERIFHNLTELEEYVNNCLQNSLLIAQFGQIPCVKVRERKGTTAAHYECDRNMIAIPLQAAWASRELVILHELAHHIHYHQYVANQGPLSVKLSHNQIFLEIYLELIRVQLGEQAKFLAWMIFVDAHIWETRT